MGGSSLAIGDYNSFSKAAKTGKVPQRHSCTQQQSRLPVTGLNLVVMVD
jgi:hypothetical protein